MRAGSIPVGQTIKKQGTTYPVFFMSDRLRTCDKALPKAFDVQEVRRDRALWRRESVCALHRVSRVARHRGYDSCRTSPSRTPYQSRRHFYKLLNAAAHSLRRSGSPPKMLTHFRESHRRRKLHIPRPSASVGTHSFCTQTRLLSRETTETVRYREGSRAVESNASAYAFPPQSPRTLRGPLFCFYRLAAYVR